MKIDTIRQAFHESLLRRLVATIIGLLCLSLPAPLDADGQPVTRPGTAQVLLATRTVTLTGYTRARRTMTVTSEVAARCTEVGADVGDPVPSSSVLARLDTTFVDLDLRETGIRMEQAASRMGYLEIETSRSRELVKRETQARTHLDLQEQNLDQARLRLKELRAEKERLEEQKVRHTLTGPSGWTVVTRDMEPGEWIAAGTPVATLGDFRTLRIPLALSPEEFTALSRSPSFAIRLPDQGTGPEPRTLEAVIFRIAPDFDPVTRKTNVELLITPPENLCRGGLRCELDLDIPEPEGTYEVPEQAVFERYGTHWVTRKDNTEIKVILLGKGKDGFVKISSRNLAAGDPLQVRP
ncbi:efflux RND transporter periplasmic adaptor subunit [Desulfoplanes sp.]